MARHRSLTSYITYHTIPWVALVLLAFLAAVIWIANQAVMDQVEERHMAQLVRFERHLNELKANIGRQVQSIAGNDIVINGIIDIENRQNYLPVFVDSFYLAGLPDSSLSMFDFNGQLLFTKSQSNARSIARLAHWQPRVLKEGKPFVQLDANGLVVVYPIIYANQPEGAMGTFIPFAHLTHLFILETGSTLVHLSSAEGNLLYLAPMPDELSQFGPDDWLGFSTTTSDGLILTSEEPKRLAKAPLRWIYLSLGGAVAAVLLGTLLSVSLSGRLAAGTVQRLHQAVRDHKHHGVQFSRPSHTSADEPLELLQLRNEFEALLQDLDATTVSRLRFDNIVNSMTEPLVLYSPRGEPLFFNRAFSAFLTRTGIKIGDSFSAIVPTSLGSSIYFPSENVDPFHREYELPQEQDDNLVMRWSRRLIQGEQNKVTGLILVGEDITQSLRIEQELKIMKLAIEEASTGITISDCRQHDSPIIYVNSAFENLTGYPREQILGRNSRFLQGKETDAAAVSRLRKAIEGGQSIQETILNYRKDGSTFYNQLTLSPIINNEGELTHYLGIQADASKRIEAENYLTMAKEEAEHSARMKSEFLASMSHEIRTPMNGVLGMLGLLEHTPLSAEQHKYVHLGQSSARSLLTLINDILDFSKIEAGKLEFEQTNFNLVSLLQDLCDTMGYRAEEKGLVLKSDFSGIEVPVVRGDPGRLRQVLTNLLSNAIKFTLEGEVSLNVTARASGDEDVYIHCHILDTGIGIPEAKQKTLFQAFSQVDATTTRRFGGTGLGLAIVNQLCELMGGTVRVNSCEGKGSEFFVELRLSVMDPSEDIEYDVKLQDCNLVLVAAPGDERDRWQQWMQQWHLDMRLVDNAKDAIALLRNDPQWPSVVLIHQDLPGIKGMQLGKAICADKALQHLSMVLLCSTDMGWNHGAECGFMACLGPVHYLSLRDLLQGLQDEQAKDTGLPELEEDRGHVLVVEDNVINQELVAGLLSHLGYSWRMADNGLQAIASLKDDQAPRVDLILMDCQMPVMDGYEATARIRAGEAGDDYLDVAIVAATANAMKEDEQRCLQAGMTDYLSKPIEKARLKSLLEKYVTATSLGA